MELNWAGAPGRGFKASAKVKLFEVGWLDNHPAKMVSPKLTVFVPRPIKPEIPVWKMLEELVCITV